MTAATRLVAGAHDGLSAALVERAGFDAVWAGGFAISASKLLPDCSVMTTDDLVARVEEMTRAVRIPVLVDCDEGYGDLATTQELVARLAAAGASGVCIEDSVHPKLNSFCDGPGRCLEDPGAFEAKLMAVRAAAPGLVLVARTEALIAGHPFPDAVDRGRRYARLADRVVIHSRFTELHQFAALARAWSDPVPLVVIPTLSPDLTWSDLLGVGFGMVIYANQGLRASIAAQERVLDQLLHPGDHLDRRERLATIDHVFGLTHLREAARGGPAR